MFAIRQVLPVEDDWFVVTRLDDRWTMARAIHWLVVRAEDGVDHVVACDAMGVPHEDPYSDRFFALGRDRSPWHGLTYQEIWDRAVPSALGIVEITHVVAAHGSPRGPDDAFELAPTEAAPFGSRLRQDRRPMAPR
ncbi:MAG: hypothetical protein AAF961_16995 [Planctomycetota bacterium]